MPKRKSATSSRSHSRRRSPDSSVRRAGWWLAVAVVALFTFLALYDGECTRRDDAALAEGNYEYVATAPGLPEQLLHYKGMTVSFNPETHQPNWVAWELTGEEADGNLPRKGNFMADPDVAASAQQSDYTNSGFDRGHMAPAGDMKWDSVAMAESFYMTNICPQLGALNSGSWKKLEEKCRQRARRDSAIVVVCGPIFDAKIPSTIGQTGVAVPSRFFKVILSPFTNPPTAIGFIMPNGYVKGGMQNCAVSVDSVEAVTGHDFFSALPDDVENDIESQCNFNKWSKVK